MKQPKKTAIVLTLVSLFLIALAIPSYSWTRTNVSKIEKFYNSKLSPIIMIPGSSATENRFDGLVTKLNQDRQGTKHSLLKVKVWNDGHITYTGSMDAKDNEPVIVVLKTTKMAIAILKSKPSYSIKPLKPFKKNTILIILRAWVIPTVA